MSVKNGRQRNANRAWIPLVLLLGGTPSIWASELDTASGPQPPVILSSAVLTSQDQVWQELMRWLIQQMMTGLNCGAASVPEDVPVAMLMVVGCYATSGLKPMRADERDEFMSVLDAVEIAMLDVPTSVSLITRLRFEATLKLMRAEALQGL